MYLHLVYIQVTEVQWHRLVIWTKASPGYLTFVLEILSDTHFKSRWIVTYFRMWLERRGPIHFGTHWHICYKYIQHWPWPPFCFWKYTVDEIYSRKLKGLKRLIFFLSRENVINRKLAALQASTDAGSPLLLPPIGFTLSLAQTKPS